MSTPLFIPSTQPPVASVNPNLWFIFDKENILLDISQGNPTIPFLDEITVNVLEIHDSLYLGQYGSDSCFVGSVDEDKQVPDHLKWFGLRDAYREIANSQLTKIVISARELLHWEQSSQFCGFCGRPTKNFSDERAKVCDSCHSLIYPRITPVILVLIYRGNKILLGRSSTFKPGIYSVLAGFVEVGETLEEAVHREVMEEVGLKIKNLSYVGSQPWPFPNNMMIGFTAEYESGELTIDKKELEDANWYDMDNLPHLPAPISLSRKIVDDFVAGKCQSEMK
jgi:NAD+ diphosphatase